MSDLAILAADTTALDLSGDPATFVVLACERAKDWLTQAVQHGDIDQIVELKSQAEAIRIYTTQKQLGKDAELAAAEIVRRAERGIGVAIRRGQEAGEIRQQGQSVVTHQPGGTRLVSPTDFVAGHELSGGGHSVGIYDLTDDVSDEQFDEAIDEAKAEQNLSRANVVRKVKGEPALERPQRSRSPETQRRYDAKQRPDVLRGTRHIDSNRVVEQTILGSGIPDSVAEQIDYSALDRDRLEGWVSSLSDVIRSLTTLKNNLKKELTRD